MIIPNIIGIRYVALLKYPTSCDVIRWAFTSIIEVLMVTVIPHIMNK